MTRYKKYLQQQGEKLENDFSVLPFQTESGVFLDAVETGTTGKFIDF